ncbi:hypothetical protein BC835DRAFT_1318526 [Cytidiella melzeri]|nr:hypothetical protein BC835DRAFT_1318526 [Cytidiella melzeri]
MSSRYDGRRREYDRGDYDRDRDRGQRHGDRPPPPPPRRDGRSRSRSPRRGAPDRDRDRRPTDRRDYVRDDRRDRDRGFRDDRRRDDRDRDRRDPQREDRREPRESERDRREPPRRDAERERVGDRGLDNSEKASGRTGPSLGDYDGKHTGGLNGSEEPQSRQLSEMPTEDGEEVEPMDATNDDDAAMMAMMGMSGFGSTKGKHVEGNQEGAASVKKMRTWRQYMNRRGGFNRPLDKIK